MTSEVVPAAGGGPSSSTGTALRPRAPPRLAVVFAAPRTVLAAEPAPFLAADVRLVGDFLAAMGLSERSGNPRGGWPDRRIRRPPSSHADRRARCGRRTAASRARSRARAPRDRALRHRRAPADGPRRQGRIALARADPERVSSCLLVSRRRVGPSGAPTSIIVARSAPADGWKFFPSRPSPGPSQSQPRAATAVGVSIIALRWWARQPASRAEWHA